MTNPVLISYLLVDIDLVLSTLHYTVHLVFVQMLWLAANTWLFLKTFLLYSTGQQYHYLYKMLGVRPDTSAYFKFICLSTQVTAELIHSSQRYILNCILLSIICTIRKMCLLLKVRYVHI